MYKWQAPSRGGIDGRKAGVCRSLVTGEVVTRKKLSLKANGEDKKGPGHVS